MLSECGSNAEKYPVSEYNRFANKKPYDSDEQSSESLRKIFYLRQSRSFNFPFYLPGRNQGIMFWSNSVLKILEKLSIKLFDFKQVDDPTLKKMEEKKDEKSAAAHTKGILMALSAGALYGVQVIYLNLIPWGWPLSKRL